MSITPEMELWLRGLETTAAPQTTGELRKNAGHLYLHLPAAAADWLGLTESQQARCVDWNDTDNLTFPQIAAKLRGELSS